MIKDLFSCRPFCISYDVYCTCTITLRMPHVEKGLLTIPEYVQLAQISMWWLLIIFSFSVFVHFNYCLSLCKSSSEVCLSISVYYFLSRVCIFCCDRVVFCCSPFYCFPYGEKEQITMSGSCMFLLCLCFIFIQKLYKSRDCNEVIVLFCLFWSWN